MTRDDRFIDQLEDYLESFDGDTPLPGHVRNAIHAELPRTRQVRPRRGPVRLLTTMSNAPSRAPWAIAAAAVVVAIVGGAWFLSGSRGDVGATAPSPARTAVPTESPTASPDASAGGTVTLDMLIGGQRVIVDDPAGWFLWYPYPDLQGILVDSGPDAPDGSGWGVAFMRVGDVFRDPCDQSAGKAPVGTVDELVTAMEAWPGFTVSSPEPTAVGGIDGQLVTVTSTTTTAGCTPQSIWLTPGGNFVDAYPMVDARGSGRAGTFRIVDVRGELLVVRTTEFGEPSPFEEDQGVASDPGRHAADLVELQGIIDSVRFESDAP
jgi:hypothetical protein